ncbi:MAG: hypothetical protein ACRCZI_10850 [Cetobacterium sp.]
MKSKLKVIISVLSFTIMLQGCSAVMAASGTKEANLSALNRGDSRSMVLAKVGQQPTRVVNDGKDIMEIYELERGNEPSTGRAVAHGVLTLATLGIWEIVGTPLEVVKGEKYFLTVYYDKDENLKKFEITSTRPN